jgi:hypothetical protein
VTLDLQLTNEFTARLTDDEWQCPADLDLTKFMQRSPSARVRQRQQMVNGRERRPALTTAMVNYIFNQTSELPPTWYTAALTKMGKYQHRVFFILQQSQHFNESRVVPNLKAEARISC